METGLDYFLARYYSSSQGRFISPDEFTGGPMALFMFADTASANPTFYADPSNPQSLNKYHYALNRPLSFVDPDGHNPCCEEPIEGAADVAIGLGKTVANTWIGMGNTTAIFMGGPFLEPFRPTNTTQAVTMAITERVSFFGGLLSGRANVGGVVVAETKSTVVVSSQQANAAAVRTANQAQQLPARPGAAGAVHAPTGEIRTTVSGSAPLNPAVQKMLDNIPAASRSKFHGTCCEPKLISQLLDEGISPKGATFSVVRVRAPGHPQHATPMAPCSTCKLLLDAINKK